MQWQESCDASDLVASWGPRRKCGLLGSGLKLKPGKFAGPALATSAVPSPFDLGHDHKPRYLAGDPCLWVSDALEGQLEKRLCGGDAPAAST